MMPDEHSKKKEESSYQNRYLDFYEFCIKDYEEFREWKRSQDITQRNNEDWNNPDFLSIKGRRL